MSLRTSAEQGMKSSTRRSAPAIWRNSMARFSSSSLTANGAMSGLITPASSLEISTRVPSRFSTSSSELLMLRTSPPLACGVGCSSNALVNSRAALSGCSRSWLTAARNLVFDRLASSASRLASRRRASTLLRSVDLAQQLIIQAGQLGGALAHTLFEVLVCLVQRLGRAPAIGDVLDQHEDARHLAVGQAIGT